MYMKAIGQITAITLGIKKISTRKYKRKFKKHEVNIPHYHPMKRGPNSKQQIGV
jgi:hypothetical protein